VTSTCTDFSSYASVSCSTVAVTSAADDPVVRRASAIRIARSMTARARASATPSATELSRMPHVGGAPSTACNSRDRSAVALRPRARSFAPRLVADAEALALVLSSRDAASGTPSDRASPSLDTVRGGAIWSGHCWYADSSNPSRWPTPEVRPSARARSSPSLRVRPLSPPRASPPRASPPRALPRRSSPRPTRQASVPEWRSGKPARYVVRRRLFASPHGGRSPAGCPRSAHKILVVHVCGRGNFRPAKWSISGEEPFGARECLHCDVGHLSGQVICCDHDRLHGLIAVHASQQPEVPPGPWRHRQ
jgi:hypothetical protein